MNRDNGFGVYYSFEESMEDWTIYRERLWRSSLSKRDKIQVSDLISVFGSPLSFTCKFVYVVVLPGFVSL